MRRIDRVGPERPRDLDVIRLAEFRKASGFNRTKRRVGFPRPGHRAHDDFAVRNLGEHNPSDRPRRGDQAAHARLRLAFGAQDHRAGPEERLYCGHPKQVELAGGRERHRRGSGDADAVAFCHFGRRQELLEQRIGLIGPRSGGRSISHPRRRDVPAIGARCAGHCRGAPAHNSRQSARRLREPTGGA